MKKEVYEAMMKMRLEVERTLGTNSRDRDSELPDLDNLPNVHIVEHPTPPSPRLPQSVGTHDRVPTEVLAAGDPTRADRKRPVAPFIPETKPQGGADPFPGLNRPMGG